MYNSQEELLDVHVDVIEKDIKASRKTNLQRLYERTAYALVTFKEGEGLADAQYCYIQH